MSARADNHIALAVSDIHAGIRFYEQVLGARLYAGPYSYEGPFIDEVFGLQGPKAQVCHLKLERNALELWQVEHPAVGGERPPYPPHGIMHFGVEVDDVAGVARAVEQAGGSQRFAVKHIGGHDETHFVYCEDPDGNVFELMDVSHDEVVRLGRERQAAQAEQAG